MEYKNLTSLQEGERGQVFKINATDSMRRRLFDLGIIEGTGVECVMKSPAGDPIAFFIRGAVIALRSEDSSQILVC